MNATTPTLAEINAARYALSNSGTDNFAASFYESFNERNPDASDEEFAAASKAASTEYIKANRAVVRAYEEASPTQRAAANGWRLKEVSPGTILARRNDVELRLTWKSFLAAESAGQLV